MSPPREPGLGDRVRVKDPCPLTLPYYARTSDGIVTEVEGDCFVITFSSGRVFPVPAIWLEVLEPAPAES